MEKQATYQVSQHQPPPIQNQQRPVIEYVIQDLRERAEVGKKEYGTYLQPYNGHDALMDAYQETLDQAMYQRQALIERDAGITCPHCGEHIDLNAERLPILP